MVKAARARASVSIEDIMNSLRFERIDFRGPFQTPQGNILFLIESHLFVLPELVDLFNRKKLDREGIQGLATQFPLSERVFEP